MRDDIGRYDRESQAPLARDVLHLGRKGLRIFAKTLKSSVIGKYKTHPARYGTLNPSQPRQHGASAGGGVHVSSPQT